MASFFGSALRRLVVAAGLFGVCAWGQGGAPAAAGKTVLVEPPAPLLRAQAGDLTSANVLERKVAAVTNDLFGPECEIAPGGAGGPCLDLLKEDGLVRVGGADYGRVKASAFEFGDATGAYSAYTFYRSKMKTPRVMGAEARLKNGTEETSADGEGTAVWAGTAVLRVSGHTTREELAALVADLPKVGGRRGVAPLLPALMPGTGLEGATLRYALGPLGYQAMGGVLPAGMLGWDKSAEGATAEYGGRSGRGALTLLLYPTPQIAGDRGRAVEKEVNDEGGKAKFGMLKMRRVGPLVGLTSGALGEEQAAKLLADMHLNLDLSYDKPMPLEFHAEVRKTASLLQNIAVLCGVLILAAVLLGFFLGFGRAGIRVLMGKPAASEPEFLTISLRDKPKALFTRRDGEDEQLVKSE